MKNIKLLVRGKRGFTLIELVVVIAILGTLAAISVPMVTNYLAQGKERAYKADVERVQQAVEAYYSAPDNERFPGGANTGGRNQYPIFGITNSSSTPGNLRNSDTDSPVTGNRKNPVGGTVGGLPTWTDAASPNNNGIRDAETLLNIASTAEGWHTAQVTRPNTTTNYWVDSRDFIIDMTKLIEKNLLDGVPKSASADNAPANTTPVPTGSYIYYVDSTGKVNTLLASFPIVTNTGFQNVFP